MIYCVVPKESFTAEVKKRWSKIYMLLTKKVDVYNNEKGVLKMAEYRVTYKDNGVIEKELDFKGETFKITMIPDETGSTSKEKNFDIQVVERFGDFDGDVLGVLGDISFADELDIEEYLEELSYYENIY